MTRIATKLPHTLKWIENKRWRFVRRRKQILDELEPDHNHWFERFQNRYNISLRRKTHCSQKPPTALEPAIKKFHSFLLRLRNTGNFKASDLANMDQTPLPFVLDDGKTYDKKVRKKFGHKVDSPA